MSHPASTITTLSTKGQVILPKAVRDLRHWGPGTRLIVEAAPGGVFLRAATPFEPVSLKDVFACLSVEGPPKSIDEMDAGIGREAARTYAGD